MAGNLTRVCLAKEIMVFARIRNNKEQISYKKYIIQPSAKILTKLEINVRRN